VTGHLLGISLALLQAEPLFVFQFLIKEEKRRLCLNCIKSFKSSQQPKLLYGQSFFFSCQTGSLSASINGHNWTHSTMGMATRPGFPQGWYSRFQVRGMIEGFWGYKFSVSGCFWVGKFRLVFLWVAWFRDLGIFSGIQNNLKICDSSHVSQSHCSEKKNFYGSEIQHGIFWEVKFWSRDFFGFCLKPYGFFWVLIFAPIWSSLSLEIQPRPGFEAVSQQHAAYARQIFYLIHVKSFLRAPKSRKWKKCSPGRMEQGLTANIIHIILFVRKIIRILCWGRSSGSIAKVINKTNSIGLQRNTCASRL